MPIYTVTDTTNGQARLVKAKTRAHAIKHVAKDFTAELPTQDEFYALIKKDINLEYAAEDDAPDETKAGAAV